MQQQFENDMVKKSCGPGHSHVSQGTHAWGHLMITEDILALGLPQKAHRLPGRSLSICENTETTVTSS